MVALAPALDLAPASFKALVDRLPPSQRAKVAWFLPELRTACVEPLRAIVDEHELAASLDDHLLRFAHLNAKLSAALVPLLREAVLRDIVVAADDERVAATHARIERRLEPIDQYAADALREAYAWFTAMLPGLVQQIGGMDQEVLVEAIAATTAADIDKQLRTQLSGEARFFLQLLAFTLAALEVIEDDTRELPRLIVAWCELALDGAHVAVPALRRAGLIIPTPSIPGITQRDWRNRWASHVLEQLRAMEEDLRRSSSTRAV